jgi:hypothetical protein
MIEPQSGSTSSTIATAVISDGEQTPSRSNVAGQSEWYEIISGPDLEQGDVLPNLSAPRAIQDDDAPGGYRIRPGHGNYVVISQTCDLENDKLQEVLLADYRDYQSAIYSTDRARSRAFRDALIQGTDWAYFLLPEFDGSPRLAWSIVNFHYLFLIDVKSVRGQAEAIGNRLRLVSPYKEHLAQSFGRYMMRIALPQTPHAFATVQPAPKPGSAPRQRSNDTRA